MIRTMSVIKLTVVRGSLAVQLSGMVDPIACGALEAAAQDACHAFHEFENLLDRAGTRLCDLLIEFGRLPAGVAVDRQVAVESLQTLDWFGPLVPNQQGAVQSAERQMLATMRTMAMSLSTHAHRQTSVLAQQIEQAEPSPERDAARSICRELVELALAVGLDRDARHPLALLWPRTVARAVRVERPRQPNPRPARFAPAPAQSFDESAFDSELQFEGSIQ